MTDKISASMSELTHPKASCASQSTFLSSQHRAEVTAGKRVNACTTTHFFLPQFIRIAMPLHTATYIHAFYVMNLLKHLYSLYIIIRFRNRQLNYNMGWPYCSSCHYTLSVEASGDIKCSVCNYQSNLSTLPELPTTTTYSSNTSTPLWAKSDSEQLALQTKEPNRATIDEPCIKCGHKPGKCVKNTFPR